LAFGVLASDTRVRILLAMADGRPRSGMELGEELGVVCSVISSHCRILEDNGFVSRGRIGSRAQYMVNKEAFEVLIDALLDIKDGVMPGQRPIASNSNKGDQR